MKAQALLTRLSECLCTEIETSDVPPVCFCGVVPGDAAAMDYMDSCDGRNGMAWVRMVSLYPAGGLNVVSETPNNLGAGIGMDIEIGLARRIPIVDEVGNLPTAEDFEAASALQNDDALVMLRAIRCCLMDEVDAIIGTYDPFGPLGAVAGGSWPLAVLLD